jgi:hypothetical protein
MPSGGQLPRSAKFDIILVGITGCPNRLFVFIFIFFMCIVFNCTLLLVFVCCAVSVVGHLAVVRTLMDENWAELNY